jgi:ferrous iron transport protein A
MSLDELKPGQACCVVDVNSEGAVSQRLLDMGFIPGTRIQVVRNAPMVDPVELIVRGAYISIRHSEAKGVEVELYE